MENKESIINILRSTNRTGIESLLEYMEANGFYTAPCSSKYHLSKPGGLAEHSLNVCKYATAMIEAFYFKQKQAFDAEFINSVCICSILHDIGKIGQFGKPTYRRMTSYTETPIPEYDINPHLLYVPHEIRSVVLASQFIELTEEEQFAILYHNGLYGELKGFKGKENPLYLILHFADMWASKVVEKEEE